MQGFRLGTCVLVWAGKLVQDAYMIAKKGAFVVVADGGGATIYKVSTRVGGVKLDDVETVDHDFSERAKTSRDLHEQAEDVFAADIAGKVNRLADKAKRGIILFAPPRFLGVVRSHLSDASRAVIAAEAPKDLTNASVAELERAVDLLDGA